MSNSYINYYLNQAGSGLSAFEGVRYQRGNGFFGRLLSGAILPALRFLGRKALSTGVDVGMDALEGNNIKESIKRRSKKAAKDVASAALNRAQRYVQTGRGKRLPILMSNLQPIKRKKSIKRSKPAKKARKNSAPKKRVKGRPKTRRTVKRKSTKHSKFDFLS